MGEPIAVGDVIAEVTARRAAEGMGATDTEQCAVIAGALHAAYEGGRLSGLIDAIRIVDAEKVRHAKAGSTGVAVDISRCCELLHDALMVRP